jgi:hypothetical protein
MSNDFRVESFEQNASQSPHPPASDASSGQPSPKGDTTSPRRHAHAAGTESSLSGMNSASATGRRASIPPNMSFFADAVVSAMPPDWLDWFTGEAGGAAVVELFAAEVRAAALRRRASVSASVRTSSSDSANANANAGYMDGSHSVSSAAVHQGQGHGGAHASGPQMDARREHERESIATTISMAMAHRGGGGGDYGGGEVHSSAPVPRRVDPSSAGGYYPPAHPHAPPPQSHMYPQSQIPTQSLSEREYYANGGDGRTQYFQRDSRRPSGQTRVWE